MKRVLIHIDVPATGGFLVTGGDTPRCQQTVTQFLLYVTERGMHAKGLLAGPIAQLEATVLSPLTATRSWPVLTSGPSRSR